MHTVKKIHKAKLFFENIIKIIKISWNCSKSIMISCVILSILLGSIVPLILIIWKNFINEAALILSGNSHNFNKAIIWIILHFIATSLDGFLRKLLSYLTKIHADYLNKYTSDLIMEKISKLDMEKFDNPSIYNDIQKINNESVSRSISILNGIVSFIKNITILLGTISIFFMFNPIIIILCFISVIPMFFVRIRILKKQFSLYNGRLEQLRLVLYLKSFFIKNENVKEMKIYGIGKYFKNIILNIYQEYIEEDKKIRKKFLKELTITDILENTISYGFKIYIFLVTIKKKYGIGDLTMYIVSIQRFQSSIEEILDTISELYEDNLYINSLFVLLDLKEEQEEKNNCDKIMFNYDFEIIEFKNVWFRYPNTKEYVLKNVNLEIKSKNVYSFVGLNGSGKTTLIKLLIGLYYPTKGEINIDGINIKNYDKESIYKNVSAIFQDFIKFPLAVKENIGLGDILNINNIDVIKNSAYKSGANKFIEQLPQKYETRLQKEWTGGVDLSLGQWQKLAIARAFMRDSTILVLDEPTASLDAFAEYEIFKTFREGVKGKTCILIAHRFSTVKLADKIFVIKDGEIIEEGSHEKLIEIKGEYYSLYKMQAEAYS
ncbi:ABC transporter ATP-binding protein/permease [Clostridium sp. FP2]|uniref:ABC transporter ATP-binding protein n=1 Tax=Clostridium sp. FP2 TaxID=2724481 RepID=UPI0013E927C2|nr:ABC transporter ATP-binding protein [Clostridium sp. FP2]MBZ9626339.1 ABC transporter ATP-binding protein/permease [Clostridium sp. FP2]